MLAQAEMLVVIVLNEKISLGTQKVTAKKWMLKAKVFIMCRSDDAYRTYMSETGKPLKLETQTMVGAWSNEK